MLDFIQNGLSSYYEQLPVNTGPSICRSALYSFSIAVIILKMNSPKAVDFTRPLALSAVAATASLVHASTSPFFNYIFENRESGPTQEALHLIFTFTLIHTLLNRPLMSKINHIVTHKKTLFFFSSHAVGVGINLLIKGMRYIHDDYANLIRNWTEPLQIHLPRQSNPAYMAI
jgi:hypothetical protein